MIRSDEAIYQLKNQIKTDVCRMAWEGRLNDDEIERYITEMFPGPKATWRCCVYKEREIVRQRVRLDMGKNVSSCLDTNNIVQVIEPACDECPIASYMVTDVCRFCLGKACLNTCRFDAISPGENHMKIDPARCKECGMCANACPYGAIIHIERPCRKACPVGALSYNEFGIAQIDEEKCVECGLCIHNCPFGAIGSKVFLVQVIEAIKAGREVYAMVAPSIEGQFGESVSLGVIRNAVKRLGFTDMVEVGLGADMTASYEALEWSEALKDGRKLTTSCCSAFINLLKKHFPETYENNMSNTVSPMCATSRLLKALHPGCMTVFIGPCIAKKDESQDESVRNNADYVMTFGELQVLTDSRDMKFEAEGEFEQEASIFGKSFASSGGVADAVIECMKERGEDVDDITLARCAGGAECKKVIMQLKAGKLPEDFVEGMFCPGGCVGGPSSRKTALEITRARKKLLSEADDRKILENLKKYPMDKFSMNRND